jgi:hypothetical protein
MPDNITQIPAPRVNFLDPANGLISRQWFRYFNNVNTIIGGGTGVIAAINGGTGFSSYAVGDMLYADTTTTFAKLPDVVIGNVLLSGGVNQPPYYGKVNLTIHVTGTLPATNGGTGINSYAIGDIIYANSTTTLAALADVVTGNALISGGVDAPPTWGKIGLTTHVDGVLPETNGGTNQSTYATGDTLYASGTNTLSKFAKPSATAIYTMDSSGVPAWKVPRYGAFYDTTNQTAAANTPTAITFNNTQISSGIAIGSPTSRVTVDTAGLYNIQFSIQFANTNASIDDVVVWLKVNGNNITASASWVSVTGKHAGVDGTALMALNLFYDFAANDYFELYWMSLGGNASLNTIPSSVTPSYPSSPSVILTVSDNIKA